MVVAAREGTVVPALGIHLDDEALRGPQEVGDVAERPGR